MLFITKEQANRIILNVADSDDEIKDHQSLPNPNLIEGYLEALYDTENHPVAPLLTYDKDGNLALLLKVKQHHFDSGKRKAKTFAICIAPVSKAGIYVIDFERNEAATEFIRLKKNEETSWENGQFQIDPEAPSIGTQSMAYLPHPLVMHLYNTQHDEKINPSLLAERFAKATAQELQDHLQGILPFLAYEAVNAKPPIHIVMTQPGRDGASTQKELEDLLHSFLNETSSQRAKAPYEMKDDSVNSAISIGSDDDEDISIDFKLSKEDKRLLMLLNARDTASFAKIGSILAEERKENKKDGFMKHFPDHAAETLINVRAGPGYSCPTKLSDQLIQLLTKSTSDQMALRQLQADLRKIGNNKEFDSHLDRLTVSSLFKKGEISTEIPVISFNKAVGINLPIFGPKGASNGTQSIKSEADFQFTISEAGSITELIEAVNNMRLFMEWITGPKLTSFAMIGIDDLIHFLEANKGRIKRIAEQAPNVCKEIQIQCANVWSTWFHDCSFEPPTRAPNFYEVLKPIESNRPPIQTLTLSSEPEPETKRRRMGEKGSGRESIKEGKNDPEKRPEKKNTNPQIVIEGNDLEQRRANFASKYAGKGTVQKLNIPKHSSKNICMRYHLLHSCKCNEKSSLFHGKLSNTFIDQLITKSTSDSLMIKKLSYMPFQIEIKGEQQIHSLNPHTNISENIDCRSTPFEPPINPTTIYPSQLVTKVKNAIQDNTRVLNQSKFNFSYTNDAALQNAQYLADNEFSIEKILAEEGMTTLSPGSEFRSNAVTFPLFDLHQNAEKLKSIATTGIVYEFKPEESYNEEDRIKDLHEAILKNINNKSAVTNPDIVEKAIEKDVNKGLSFIVPLPVAADIKDKIGFVPLGTSEQWTKDAEGNPKRKVRTTQDCSRLRKSGFSINNSIDDDSFECYFGFCLNRVLMKLLALRRKYPDTPIGLSKHDMDSAYRRIHVFFKHALLQCWAWLTYAIINFRLPFGVKSAAPEFSFVSDFTVDLAQWLCDDESWDPTELSSSFAETIPAPQFQIGPKENARPLMYEVKVKDINTDGFIDDLITLVALLSKQIIERARNAIPLALDAIFRPLDPNDNFERVDILSYEKLLAEGGLRERQTILGWDIDTALLRAYLPHHKAKRYLGEISKILDKSHRKELIKANDLEKLIGKLVHVAQIAKEGYLFLNRFRDRLKQWKDPKYPTFKRHLKSEDIKDLHLWIVIIKNCETKGRSLNRMLDTVPEYAVTSDACEHGLGGWINTGAAWRFEIPRELQGYLSINVLETIAAFWSIKLCIDIYGSRKILTNVDSTSAKSWIRRNRFDPTESPAHDTICRKLGKILLDNDSAIDIRHIYGESNVIADSLSRDTHLSHLSYSNALKQVLPRELPAPFEIIEQNSNELLMLLQELVLLIPSKMQTLKAPRRSELPLSSYGANTCEDVEEGRVIFSMDSTAKKRFSSAPPFATRTEMENWETQSGIRKSAQEQFEMPSHKLERHAACMVNPTHF